MKKMPTEILFLTVIALAIGYLLVENTIRHYKRSQTVEEHPSMEKINISEEEWKKRLTPQEYRILREKGTEPAFCGAFWDNKEKGIYKCRACGLPLFISSTKYDSKTGWPSFFQPIDDKRIILEEDTSHGMKRTEVLCARCGSHLGHVFDDGPPPTGKRYCINSFSLEFVKEKDQQK